MGDLGETLEKVNTKLKFLKLAENDDDRILGRNDEQEMKKYLQKFEEKIEEIRELKYKVQEQMIQNELSEEEVTRWSADLEEGIAKTVTTSEVIKRAIAKFKDEAGNYKRYLHDKEEEKRMQRRLEEERRIQEIKAEMKKLKKTEERRESREDEVRGQGKASQAGNKSVRRYTSKLVSS